MSKLTTAAVAALFVIGTTGAIAQNTPNEPKTEAAPKGPSSSGAVKDEKPTDPNAPRTQSEIEKLKKDEKASSKSTGG